MKVLYGVVGEGMGHAIRSRVVIDYLLSKGHEVEIMASSRACDFLKKRYGGEGVNRVSGFHLIYEDNRVRRGKTAWANIQSGVVGIPRNIAAYFKLVDKFQPKVVVSDFESWTYLYGIVHRLPVISVDNMQLINRCAIPQSVVWGATDDFRLAKAFVKSKLPFCSHYLVTTFFRPEVRKSRTELVPPILRPELMERRPSQGEHLLVYQTGEGHEALAETLRQTGVECRIYGMRRSIEQDEVEDNLRYRPFSERVFVEDLASCRGVIAGGGFTLMGEAVYLHKPMLAVPMGRQFEQLLNARYLQHEGYGMAADHLDTAEPIEAFIRRLPEYRARLSSYCQQGNDVALGRLTELLDRADAGVL